MRLTRRHVLAAAGFFSAAAVVGTATVGAAYQAWWDQPRDRATLHVSRDELDFLDALADAIFPPSPLLPLRGRDANVGRYVDLVLDGMAPLQRKLLRASLHGLDQYPRLTLGRPFRELGPDESAAVLAAWVGSGLPELRGVVASVYIFVTMAYSIHPLIAPIFEAQFLCGYGE
ncbi:MAG: gluconate 2-dehydrogenase subunit 3 family protein [Myxococcales bacterium]|nr:gluconate 2-dehydrogenase subunit 3 family protein [Myxococcales bacterium]